MGTWVLNGTTVKLQDNNNTVAIGTDTTPPGRKLEVTGTARLSLEDRGGEVYNVKAFGAVGDGVANDRRPIQIAISTAEAARSGIVYFPPGTYLISDGGAQPDLLTFTQPVQFLGAGPFLSVITTDQPTKNMFHGTVTVTDLNDKVRPVIFRDLKLDATVSRVADAAIRQDVAPGSTFQHGIRIENCHFRRQYIGVQLRGASTSVIENCTFWSGIASEADVWVDEQVGGDSTTHLIVGCLFADTPQTAGKAVKLTGKCGGDRIIGNLFVNYENQIHYEIDGGGGPTPTTGTAQVVQSNVMEGARIAAVRMTGADHQRQTLISGNTIRVGQPPAGAPPRRCILADPQGTSAFAFMIVVVGNKLAGEGGTKGVEISPTGGANTDGWLIAENQFEGFSTAVEAGAGVTGLMLGNNAYIGNAVNLADSSTGGKGAAFLDRVGIGAENRVTPAKELHVRSALAARPRIYLEGAAGVSSPGVEFAFDATNTRRAALVGAASGTSGVQLELFTKPDGGGPAQRLVVDRDGNALWRSGFQEMVQVPSDPPAPAVGRARLFLRDTGTGKTQFCVRFASGPVHVIATEP